MKENTLYKKCVYKSIHRGCKELDILMQHYANTKLQKLNKNELQLYAEFIELDDSTIYDWIAYSKPIRKKYNNHVVIEFIEIAKNKHLYYNHR